MPPWGRADASSPNLSKVAPRVNTTDPPVLMCPPSSLDRFESSGDLFPRDLFP